MKKPSLATALNAAKEAPPAAPKHTATVTALHGAVPPSRVGKKVISGHFDPATARQLKQLALDNQTSVQALLAEAIKLLFEKYDGTAPRFKPPSGRAGTTR
jgi:hypothetical protein